MSPTISGKEDGYMQRRIANVDVETGEVMDGLVAFIAPKRQNAFNGWIAMAQTALLQLASSDLRGTDLKVLLICLAKMNWDNGIPINQSQMAIEIGIAASHFNRSLKRLMDFGIISRRVDKGVKVYRLNPHFGWKGSAKNHRQAVTNLKLSS